MKKAQKEKYIQIKVDLLLPQRYKLKLYLENIKCRQMWYL